MLDTPNPAPLPPLDLDPGLTAAKRPVGRPAISAEQRALSDQKYAQIMELMGELPVEAKEPRFHIYPARTRVDQKLSFKPLARALLSEFKDKNFKEPGTLAAYLLDRFGVGRYCIEAYDAHGHRLDKIPSWYVTAGEPSMLEDEDDGGRYHDEDDYDDAPPRRRRGARRLRDDDLDDPVSERANMADLLITNARQASGQAAVAARSQTDMISIVMMQQTAQTEARAAEERRREDARMEERRREEARSEERRKEAADERRREEDRAERERKDEREREERRRQEQAEERRREEDKRQREHLAAIEAANKRTELLVGALPTLGTIFGKVFEKRETPMEVALTRSLTEKKEDPVLAVLLKSVLDRGDRKDSTEVMMSQMAEFSKISSQMTADQMRIMMTTSSEFNREMMKKAMDMMLASPQGQTPEGKNFIEQVMGAISGAADIVNKLVPAPAPPQPQQQLQAPQQRRALPHQRQQAPQQQPQPAQPAQAAQPAQSQQLTPEQQAELDQAPKGVIGVLAALMTIHGKQYNTQEDYQRLIAYCLSQMPVDLRVAIIEGQEATVFAIVQPYYEAVPELKAWITKPDVLLWIRDYVPKLTPHILAMHGSHDEQRAQLQNLLAQEAREAEEARLAAEAQAQAGTAPTGHPAEQAAAQPPQPGNVVQPAPPQPGNAVQPPTDDGGLAVTPDGGGAPEVAPPADPGPADHILPAQPQLMEGAAVGGAVLASGPVAVPVAAKAASHLDPDEP
jgi:hypothetical protein